MGEKVEQRAAFPQAVRVLRCRKTRRYYTGAGGSDNAEEAEKYRDEIHAAQACVTKQLHDVELVLRTQVTGTELFSTVVR